MHTIQKRLKIMDSKQVLVLNYVRRFGVELELNAFDNRNRPLNYESGKLPDGIYYVGNLVQKTTQSDVTIHKWGNDHHNENWIIKPDASCGIEVCTPVLKGWSGLMQLCKVVEAFSKDENIKVDDRCSVHVHVDVSDLNKQQIASIITWWVKFEPVFLDSVPKNRKRNQYCQSLGQTDIFDHIEDSLLSPDTLISRLGQSKYYTMNTFHYHNDKRKTLEFRIMDSDCCLDAYMIKNWVRLLLHFVEVAIIRGLPGPYKIGEKWTSYCWLDPVDLFEFLCFTPDESATLSPGLTQVKNWFVKRLNTQKDSHLIGVMSNQGRRIAHEQIEKLAASVAETEVTTCSIFGKEYRV